MKVTKKTTKSENMMNKKKYCAILNECCRKKKNIEMNEKL